MSDGSEGTCQWKAPRSESLTRNKHRRSGMPATRRSPMTPLPLPPPVTVSGEIVGALSVLVPRFRLSESDNERVGSIVKRHADRLSDLLMGRPPAN